MSTKSTCLNSPSAGVRLTFGMYKGSTLAEVDRGYLEWLVEGWDGKRYAWLIGEIKKYLGIADDAPAETGPHDYDTYLNDLRNRGNWFVIPRCFLRVFAYDEALVLCHLLNVAAHKADEDGWLPCLSTHLEDSIGLDLDDQKRILRSLEEMGVIEQAKRGNPPRRHVRIDVHRIEELLGEARP